MSGDSYQAIYALSASGGWTFCKRSRGRSTSRSCLFTAEEDEMHGPCESCGSSRHSESNCPNPRAVVEDTEGDLRRALVRALDDVKRGDDNISTLLLTIDHATSFQWGEYEARHSSGEAWSVYLVRPAGRDGLNGSRLEQAGMTRENAMALAKSLGKSAPMSQVRDRATERK